jgi:hypothetical protein
MHPKCSRRCTFRLMAGQRACERIGGERPTTESVPPLAAVSITACWTRLIET